METSQLLRHQTIKRLLEGNTDKFERIIKSIWEPLAIQIVSTVGEDGFTAIYARALFLTQKTYPWLETCPQSFSTQSRFADLKQVFEGQPETQITEANSLLLITLTDILASLIGESLIKRILQLAWCHDMPKETKESVQ